MNPPDLQLELADEAATEALGRALAELLPARALVGLNGTLGAGKTRLVQALAGALGIARREVVSPTFVLVQEYHAARSLYHADAYRLRDTDEFLQLGLDEQFDADVLVVIEWAERIADCLPTDRLDIRLEVIDDQRRRASFWAGHNRFEPVLATLHERMATRSSPAVG